MSESRIWTPWRPATTRSCRPRAISKSIRRISRSTPKASSPPMAERKPPAGVKSWSTRKRLHPPVVGDPSEEKHAVPGAGRRIVGPRCPRTAAPTIMNRIADPETSEDDGLWKLMVKGLPDDPFMPLYLAQAWGRGAAP
ncbi:MAG: hypothetical protein ACLRWP_10570 [Bilophila wadsworthia]